MKRKLILASEFTACAARLYPYLGDRQGKRAVFIPTAAIGEGFDPSVERDTLAGLGYEVVDFDITGHSRDEAARVLEGASLVYVSGGNTFYLLEQILKSGFSSPLMEALDRGVLYIGSSAGAIVCGTDIAHVSKMDNPAKANLRTTKGLGLVDYVLLPHFDHPDGGEERLQIAAHYDGVSPLLALCDHQFLYVDGKVTRHF